VNNAINLMTLILLLVFGVMIYCLMIRFIAF